MTTNKGVARLFVSEGPQRVERDLIQMGVLVESGALPMGSEANQQPKRSCEHTHENNIFLECSFNSICNFMCEKLSYFRIYM